jgi:hypothetical protein
MGANYSNKDPLIYFPFQLTPLEMQQLLMQFEMNCDFDEHEIITEKKERKFLKRVCVYKLITSPVEILFTLLIFGFTELKYKLKVTSLYYKFLFNKISLSDFGKEVSQLLQSGKVI